VSWAAASHQLVTAHALLLLTSIWCTLHSKQQAHHNKTRRQNQYVAFSATILPQQEGYGYSATSSLLEGTTIARW
jgi:hypothetical protein